MGVDAALPKTWREARRLGVLQYFTGKPCKHGHLAARPTDTGKCPVCQTAYYKAYYLQKMAGEGAESFRARKAAATKAKRLRQMAEEGTENYRKRMTAAAKAKRLRRMAGGHTDDYYDEVARKDQERIARNPEKYKAVRRRRNPLKTSGHRTYIARTPPWITEAELKAIKLFYAARPSGHHVDHIIPICPPPDCPIVGIHVRGNLQHLLQRASQKKGFKFTCTGAQAADYVARGLAIWAKDVDAQGFVNWQAYTGDKLAAFCAAVIATFGGDRWTTRELIAAAKTSPALRPAVEAIGAGAVPELSFWLRRNAGLQSGGWRILRVGMKENTATWRVETVAV